MNSQDEFDEAPRGSEEEASSSENSTAVRRFLLIDQPGTDSIENDGMKRAAAKKLIERYFYQLTDGCGNPKCNNKFCVSSGEITNLTPNEAAAKAIKLFSQEAPICETHPSKVPRTSEDASDSFATDKTNITDQPSVSSTSSAIELANKPGSSSSSHFIGDSLLQATNDVSLQSTPDHGDSCSTGHTNGIPLTEERIYELCEECVQKEAPQILIRALGEAFGQPSILARCFPAKRKPLDSTAKTDGTSSENVAKEALRASETDPDKDEDSIAGPGLDVESCRRAFARLKDVPSEYYDSALVTALTALSDTIEIDLRITQKINIDDIINCFVIAFEIPNLGSGEYLEIALPSLCHAADYLSVKAQAKLARMWALHCKDSLRHILQSLQQMITLKLISSTYSRNYCVQEDDCITLATKLMKVVYYANMLAGVMEPNSLREEGVILPSQLDPLNEGFSTQKLAKQMVPEDPLGIELGINFLDCRKPYLPFEEFYNEPLSDAVEMDKDFAYYKADSGSSSGKTWKFSFMRYPFILTVATKVLGLYFDNRIRMYSERRVSILQAVVATTSPMPYLRLKVRRQHLVDDALVELEMAAMQRALDLKKQLVVEFEGEQGVDEGGVSKEFFQLIVEQIFNPDYGMFTYHDDTHSYWFNPTSFESEGQFTLIGIVLGLAIYNNVILAVNLPMVMYRKLMGKKGSFEDLADLNPSLYTGLKNMLEYAENDMEETFIQTFRICYQDVFGNAIFHELKDNGDQIFVNQENKQHTLPDPSNLARWSYAEDSSCPLCSNTPCTARHILAGCKVALDQGRYTYRHDKVLAVIREEFVDLYSDFLLNKSVESQFRAFRRGFIMVTDESPMSILFRPEEVEQLVCGSSNFDFEELEAATEYDGGYTASSEAIRRFWSVAHALEPEEKRALLRFTTGSDRVPAGGLRRLRLLVARSGPDCERLPTAHTCFNVLLLPEYSSEDKLRERLLKAITYSQGFGML